MTKRIQAKHKISRRLGVDLWGSGKISRDKSYPPGQHGPKLISRRRSDYGLHLVAKQKLKGYYGNIKEKQLRKIYLQAKKRKGDTSENLIGLLESRLDAAIYHAGLAPSVFAVRQFINHKHVTVNGKTVNIGSYRLKEGDVIAIKDKLKQSVVFIENLEKRNNQTPSYLEVDKVAATVTFLREPKLVEVPYAAIMEPNLVVEYYSK